MRACKKIALALALVLAFSLCGCMQALGGPVAVAAAAPTPTPELILRYAENQPEDYPTTQAAYAFADAVQARTGGRVQVRVFAGGALGSEQSVIQQMQYGGVDCARISLSQLAEYDPALNVLQLPYLYTDADQMWRVLDGAIGDEFLQSLDVLGLIGLSWFDAGVRSIYTRKKVGTLEDLAGLRIRVQESSFMSEIMSALGAVPVPLVYSQVYAALNQDEIDGAENNWNSYALMSHYEVAPYFFLDEHTRVPEAQIISALTMDKLAALDETFPRIVRDCAEESARLERALWVKTEQESEKTVRAAGCEVTALSPAEEEKFRAAVEPIYEDFPAETAELIRRIRAS